jgi:hypothetical protein
MLLQLASQPGGACIVPHQVQAPQFEVGLLLHVSDPFTNRPQQRCAIQFIVELLCQADKLEHDFLFVNYHQDLIVGLFESLFKAAMTAEFFDDIIRSNGVHTVLTLLRRRVRSCTSLVVIPSFTTCLVAHVTFAARDMFLQLCREVPLGTPSSLSPDVQQQLATQSAQRCRVYKHL